MISRSEAGLYSYVGAEYMYAFGPSLEAAEQDGVALSFYKSWNATWLDPTPYFSNLSEFTVGVDIKNCSEHFKLTDPALSAVFVQVTGYEELAKRVLALRNSA